MHSSRLVRRLPRWALLAPLLVAAVPAAGQHRRPRSDAHPASLARRNHAFLRALLNDPDSAAAFFPRHGDWTWVKLTEYETGHEVIGLQRFRGADAARVLNPGGPMCNAVLYTGEVSTDLGEQVYYAVEEGRSWKRFRGRRFTPDGRDSPIFVEWRRENGGWVVAALGTTWYASRSMPGADIRTAVRDRVRGQPPAWGYAERADWFVNGEPFSFSTLRYVKYGLPRELSPDSLQRIAVLRGVPVYAEAGAPSTPEILYVPVRPAIYQPYSGTGAPPCE